MCKYSTTYLYDIINIDVNIFEQVALKLFRLIIYIKTTRIKNKTNKKLYKM